MKFNHLEVYNVGYFVHMQRALGFFIKCVLWTGEVFVHAFYPDLFTDTASRIKQEIKRLEESC
jgi:hypothetical protein